MRALSKREMLLVGGGLGTINVTGWYPSPTGGGLVCFSGTLGPQGTPDISYTNTSSKSVNGGPSGGAPLNILQCPVGDQIHITLTVQGSTDTYDVTCTPLSNTHSSGSTFWSDLEKGLAAYQAGQLAKSAGTWIVDNWEFFF